MRILRVKNYEEMSRKTADMILAEILLKPNAVLGLATGASPVGIYRELVAAYNQGDADFSEVTTINLDEYKGVSRECRQSYWYFMQNNLFQHVNVKADRIFIPDGEGRSVLEVCREYDKVIESTGGIDMQLLGIGMDGHIGFNEPANHFECNTHLVKLAESTIDVNQKFFDCREDVPKQAYTMGIKPIMQAKRVIMIASGKQKAGILKAAFDGPVTPRIPASILQLHADFTLIADEDALCEMKAEKKQ